MNEKQKLKKLEKNYIPIILINLGNKYEKINKGNKNSISTYWKEKNF